VRLRRPRIALVAASIALGLALTIGARLALSERPSLQVATPPLPEEIAIVEPAPTPPAPLPKKKPRRARKATKKIAPAPPAKPGWLSIDTRPWTRVWLGDRILGDTPLERVEVPAGSHLLRLENAEANLSQTLSVEVKPERVSRVRRTFTP
jgi:serine/threonine-protein kinase